MALNNQETRWAGRAESVHEIAQGLVSTFGHSGTVQLGRSFLAGLRQLALGDFLDSAKTDAPPSGSKLEAIVGPVTDALNELFEGSQPRTSKDIVSTLERIAAVSGQAHDDIATIMEADPHSVESVIDEFERDYQVSLLAALTAHVGVLQKAGEWEGERRRRGRTAAPGYLDIPTMTFVDDPGSGRVSMHVVDSAIDSGLNFMTPHVRASVDRPPALQRILFGQWFTYIFSTWEDVYRERLARAHGTDSEGKPWSKNDVTSEFFAEVRQIRHDFAHHAGICKNSSDNEQLNWADEGTPIHGDVSQMIALLGKFPRAELLRIPERASEKRLPLPWALPEEFVERVKTRMNRISRRRRSDILQAAVQKWLDEDPEPMVCTAATRQQQ